MDDPLIGRVVAARYLVEERLGSGSMGAVYRARHVATGGVLALKFLHGSALGDEHLVKRFTLEAQNAAQLHHPNSVRVSDFGVDQGVLYLAMEHVPGRSLAALIHDEAPLPAARAVAIARQILAALGEAHTHARRIVHRDVKPANVMITRAAGAGDIVKVVDFGISRALAGSGAGTAGFVGTPYYAAPEVWRGDVIDARADVYAVGCVLHEMLTGRPPFSAGASTSLAALMTAHVGADRALPALAAARVPAALQAVVRRLVAIEPDARPANAEVAVRELDRAMRPSSRGRVVLFVALAAAFGVALAVVIGGGDARRALEQCMPPGARTAVDTEHDGYEARLSDADHRGADGAPLATAGAVLMRDRENLLAGRGDADDQSDRRLAAADVRQEVARVIDATLAESLRAAIVDGRVRVRVEFYTGKRGGQTGGLCVTVLTD